MSVIVVPEVAVAADSEGPHECRGATVQLDGDDVRASVHDGAVMAPVGAGWVNDNDREGLRQMLSSLRRDPMDVEDDPDNNDGSFFPCEFCGDPYPCEFLMRHQVRMHLLFPFILCMI